MKPDRYLLEKVLRWGFSVAMLAVLALSFYESPFYRLTADFITKRDKALCHLKISRDFEHTATLGIPGIDNFLTTVNELHQGVDLAMKACLRDKNLKTLYVRQTCDEEGGQLSRTVFCR